jgi:hypothetical protein
MMAASPDLPSGGWDFSALSPGRAAASGPGLIEVSGARQAGLNERLLSMRFSTG